MCEIWCVRIVLGYTCSQVNHTRSYLLWIAAYFEALSMFLMEVPILKLETAFM